MKRLIVNEGVQFEQWDDLEDLLTNDRQGVCWLGMDPSDTRLQGSVTKVDYDKKTIGDRHCNTVTMSSVIERNRGKGWYRVAR
jgi:hypothetical protein